MEQLQLDIALEIVKLDCTYRGGLKNPEVLGEFCIVGGLYAVLDPDWAITPGQDMNWDHYAAVQEAFNIFDIDAVYEANDTLELDDSVDELNARRERVAEVLRSQLDD